MSLHCSTRAGTRPTDDIAGERSYTTKTAPLIPTQAAPMRGGWWWPVCEWDWAVVLCACLCLVCVRWSGVVVCVGVAVGVGVCWLFALRFLPDACQFVVHPLGLVGVPRVVLSLLGVHVCHVCSCVGVLLSCLHCHG